MLLRVINHKFHYEMENLCRVFFPYEQIKVLRNGEEEESDFTVTTSLSEEKGSFSVFVSVIYNGEETSSDSVVSDCKDCERSMAVCLFGLLSALTGYRPRWGILTGVRPSKLMNTLIDEKGQEQAVSWFEDKLLVSPQKTELAVSVAKAEKKIMELSDVNSFSLYVSVPFCPTRCNYCSFVSHSVAQAKKLLPDYIDKLCEEIRFTGEIAEKAGLRLESVYWGGGTPTILEACDIKHICGEIENSFDLSHIREYTIEAGRADTVTPEKLRVIKDAGVTRISINPQTFNDDVLRAIGRKHTVDDVLRAFSWAREAGFGNINMDLIAGLTDDSFQSFCNSVDRACEMSPENITLHTLTLKRSSNIVTGHIDVISGELANEMLIYAQNKFCESGYIPYYMYRQTRSLGNLENVGWCRPEYECLYNIFMMEECHTVLAVGAGAVTKLKDPYSRNIERIFNYKYPYEYISDFHKMKDRKKYVTEFYNNFSNKK